MSIKNKTKNVGPRGLKFGKGDLLDESIFDPRKVKVRITTFIDEDILLQLKEHAENNNTKYQTVLNSLLRSFFDKSSKSSNSKTLSEKQVRRIVREELRKKV